VQKYLSDTLKNKNSKISIGFFSLQGDPTLLMAWMLFTTGFLFPSTVLYVFYAAQYFAIEDTTKGAGCIIGVVIYVCK